MKKRSLQLILALFITCMAILTDRLALSAPPNPDGTVPIRPMFKDANPPTPQFNAPQNPPAPGQGIYNHQIYSATSPDSLTWTKDGALIFDHASVPEAVITEDGIIHLYFMDASEGHQMSVAISKDLGKTWSKSAVEISNRQEQDGGAVDPNVILMPDNSFRMFYFGSFGKILQGQTSGISRIYSATSTDGIHFTEESGTRFFKRGLITDPDAMRTLKYWKLFVAEGEKNLSTTSKDGTTFTEDASAASTKGAISKTIAVPGGYRMYRCGKGGIESQFSTNLKDWKQEGVRLTPDAQRITCDPTVIQLPDGSYKMYYKTAPMQNMAPPPKMD